MKVLEMIKDVTKREDKKCKFKNGSKRHFCIGIDKKKVNLDGTGKKNVRNTISKKISRLSVL